MEELNNQYQLEDYKEMNLTYWPLMKKLETAFNVSGGMNFSKTSSIADSLIVDRFLGKPLPPQLTEADYLNIHHL